MQRPPLSVTFITLNEAKKIEASLKAASFADELIVVDSGSSDGTPEIAARLGARVFHNPWPGFGQQKNFAASKASNDWVLNLDADEVLTPELVSEIEQWLARAPKTGKLPILSLPRKTFYHSQWIRFGGWYPNAVARLGHRSQARWTEPKLHEALKGEGEVQVARHPLLHYSFDSISDQVATNLKYARLGAEELARRGRRFSLALLVLKPISKFLECYFWKLGFLDGRLGFVIAVNAAHSMFLKQAFLLELIGKNKDPS
jgi:glycosyltransferase involved in cell wall biosynthesis